MIETEASKKEIIRTLKEARQLIAGPYRWGKRSLRHTTTTRNGDKVVSHCALGAVIEVATFASEASGLSPYSLFNTEKLRACEFSLAKTITLEDPSYVLEYDPALHYQVRQTIVDYNDDTRTKKVDVIKLFDKTIARLEAL